jgi:uncharacterized protein (DUF1684 family)
MKRVVIFLIFSVVTLTVASGQANYASKMLTYQQNYKKDLSAIIQSDTSYVKFFPIDSAFRVTAKVQLIASKSFFPMETSNKSSKDATKYALIIFKLQGKEYRLFAYQLQQLLDSKDYHSNFFIPFMERTTGKASYGGGRYIDFVTTDIKKGELLLDFNKAYNPYCAFKKGYSCPIPPEENRLSVSINAGEMNFVK